MDATRIKPFGSEGTVVIVSIYLLQELEGIPA